MSAVRVANLVVRRAFVRPVLSAVSSAFDTLLVTMATAPTNGGGGGHVVRACGDLSERRRPCARVGGSA